MSKKSGDPTLPYHSYHFTKFSGIGLAVSAHLCFLALRAVRSPKIKSLFVSDRDRNYFTRERVASTSLTTFATCALDELLLEKRHPSGLLWRLTGKDAQSLAG